MPAFACQAMRTRFEVLIADAGDPARLRASGEEALAAVEEVEGLLSIYRDDAQLFRINRLAGQQAVRADARVMAVLQRSLEVCIASDGAFDPAMGALVQVWDVPGHIDRGEAGLPGSARLEAALACSGMRRLVVLDHDQGTVRFSAPGVRLDAGAVGKGYALEQAAAVLRDLGIRSALMHGGTSSVVALGRMADQRPWRVAIRHPADGQAVVAVADLSDASLGVSAVHGRSIEVAGQRYGHVIDPRNGWPVQGHLLAAVIHEQALLSDAWSTALLVLGQQGLDLLAARLPGADALLVRQHATSGELVVDCVGSRFTRTACA